VQQLTSRRNPERARDLRSHRTRRGGRSEKGRGKGMMRLNLEPSKAKRLYRTLHSCCREDPADALVSKRRRTDQGTRNLPSKTVQAKIKSLGIKFVASSDGTLHKLASEEGEQNAVSAGEGKKTQKGGGEKLLQTWLRLPSWLSSATGWSCRSGRLAPEKAGRGGRTCRMGSYF